MEILVFVFVHKYDVGTFMWDCSHIHAQVEFTERPQVLVFAFHLLAESLLSPVSFSLKELCDYRGILPHSALHGFWGSKYGSSDLPGKRFLHLAISLTHENTLSSVFCSKLALPQMEPETFAAVL